MSEIKLLSCPFCGGEASLTNLIHEDCHGQSLWNVYCIGCNASTQAYWDKEVAIEDWNTRKPMERIVERLEEKREYYYLNDDVYDVIAVDALDYAIDIVRESGNVSDITQEIYNYIKAYIEENGYAPKYDEIGDAVGISAATVTKQIKKLQEMGLIHRVKGKWRGIKLVEKPDWKEMMMEKFIKSE